MNGISATAISQQVDGRPFKRSRTAVACRRCKHRKQKCDGSHPICSNCANSNCANCEYDYSPTLNRSQEQYARAQRRVEELEGILSRLGEVHDGGGRDAPSSEASSPELAARAKARIPSKASQVSPPTAKEAPSGGSPQCFEDVLRHLSLQATGGYVDSSSTVTLGRMMQAVVAPKRQPDEVPGGGLLEQNLSPKSLDVVVQPTGRSHISLSGIPDVIADRMLEKGYFGYIATLWPLMQPSDLRRLHQQRATLDDHYEIAALHLVYATAGRFLETTGETGSFRSEQHYQAAAVFLDEILSLHDIRSVQTLLLLAIYSLRAPRGPGAWSFVGMAMRMCIELGLHRKRRVSSEIATQGDELRRRVFWSCYCLDRQISVILGRPFAISDHDIDAELPTGADDEESQRLTACFVRICRLRIIESRIQQNLYSVGSLYDSRSPELDIRMFIEQLDQWRADIPLDGQGPDSRSINTSDSYLVYYYQAMRLLLHPHITSPQAQDQYLSRAVDACGGICQTYKRLHQNVTVGFSLMALHSVFFAGLTMLYCAWKLPSLLLAYTTREKISDCSIVLYIITERWPGAKRYRDLFEAIKEPVLRTIDTHQHQPQTTIEQLQANVHGTLRSIVPAENGQDEFSAMLLEMTGGHGVTDNSQSQQQEREYDGAFSPNDPSIIPGLAFDFAGSDIFANAQSPFDPSQFQWSPGFGTGVDTGRSANAPTYPVHEC